MIEMDTIAAISTALGEGAIGIVRLSGPKAIAIADRFVSIGKKKKLSTVASHTIHYGHAYQVESKALVDEVMVTVMKAPKTYTREDTVEINCHGGILAVNQILEEALAAGARLAEPGEFTKRAFLNGRIDLSQAEAVMDIIQAKSSRAKDLALGQLEGKLSLKIKALRQEMLETLAAIEVTIDYPEYDEAEEMTLQKIKETAETIQGKIKRLLQEAKQGKLVREGIKTAIIGRPNVGKSSLLNALLQEDKAIVTAIAGTTRDTIEETVTIRGIPLTLMDTAGIRETDDLVEQIGVQRSQEAIQRSDLILLVLNQSQVLTEEDRRLLQVTADKKRIILLNKADLDKQVTKEDLAEVITANSPVITTSMRTDQGIEQLEEAIMTLFMGGEIAEQDMTYISNARHIQLLKEALAALDEVLKAVDLGVGVDLIQIDLTRSWDLLGQITGESAPDELLDQLFSQFCLGK